MYTTFSFRDISVFLNNTQRIKMQKPTFTQKEKSA